MSQTISGHLIYGVFLGGGEEGLLCDEPEPDGTNVDLVEWLLSELTSAGQAPGVSLKEARRNMEVLEVGDDLFLTSHSFRTLGWRRAGPSWTGIKLEMPVRHVDEDLAWACEVLGMKPQTPRWYLATQVA